MLLCLCREACQRVLADHPKYVRAEANICQTVDGVCSYIQKVLAIVCNTAGEDQNQLPESPAVDNVMPDKLAVEELETRTLHCN